MSWETVDQYDIDGTVQVHPLDDLIAHDLSADNCVCGPKVEILCPPKGKAARLVSHASLDGRELSE